MPADTPAASSNVGEAKKIAGRDSSRTTTQRGNAPPDSFSSDSDQGLVSSGRVAISQHPNPKTRKRVRIDDEEDELVLPAKQTRMRTPAMPGLENWEAFTLKALAQRDPEALCALLDASRAENKRRCSQIEHLEAVIEHEKESQKEKRCSLNKEIKVLRKKMEALLKNPTDFGTKKASDDTIKSMWCQLSYRIKNTVSNYFTEWPQEEMIVINGVEYDQHAQSAWADEIMHTRRSIGRRQLWNTLFRDVFSGNEEDCHGEIGGMLARLISKFDPHILLCPQYLQMISKMKSALDLKLERDEGPNDVHPPENLVQDIVKCFQSRVLDDAMNLFEADIRRILWEAWKIHSATMTSKAIFIMQWSEDGDGNNDCDYDPDTMEFLDSSDATGASERTVRVVESPVLWKIGNGDGENFDSTMVVCKHCVFPGWEKEESGTCTVDESSP
ncbi:hypothetical protein V8C42DRAFT_340422 [Trichoderma barbatum]